MFPEYVEKFNQQQSCEQTLSEQKPATQSEEESTPSTDKDGNAIGENLNRVETLKGKHQNQRQSFPVWVLLLLVSVFGMVMALPLLQP